jgi:hypothetical protein
MKKNTPEKPRCHMHPNAQYGETKVNFMLKILEKIQVGSETGSDPKQDPIRNHLQSRNRI